MSLSVTGITLTLSIAQDIITATAAKSYRERCCKGYKWDNLYHAWVKFCRPLDSLETFRSTMASRQTLKFLQKCAVCTLVRHIRKFTQLSPNSCKQGTPEHRKGKRAAVETKRLNPWVVFSRGEYRPVAKGEVHPPSSLCPEIFLFRGAVGRERVGTAFQHLFHIFL